MYESFLFLSDLNFNVYFSLYPCKKGTGMIQQWEDAAAVTWKLDQETSQIIRQDTQYPHNAQNLR